MVVQVVSSPDLLTVRIRGGFLNINNMGVLNYKKYNNRVRRFIKFLDKRPWMIDTISDIEDEKIRAEFLKIFKPKKKIVKDDISNECGCKGNHCDCI